MSTWPDTDYAAIDRHIRSLTLRHPKSRRIYRSELITFQRFIVQHADAGALTQASLITWVQARARQIPLPLVIDRAGKVNRFLESLVRNRSLGVNPFTALRDRYGERRLAPIVRALAGTDPARLWRHCVRRHDGEVHSGR